MSTKSKDGLYPREGVRGTTWGYRFRYAGKLHQQDGFLTHGLAKHTRDLVRGNLIRGVQDPVKPPAALIPWDLALERYAPLKAGFATQAQILFRVRWWADYFQQSHGVHYVQHVTSEHVVLGLKALERRAPSETMTGRGRRAHGGLSPMSRRHYLGELRGFYGAVCGIWKVMTFAEDPTDKRSVKGPPLTDFEPRILDELELKRAVLASTPLIRDYIVIALLAGLRQKAILTLQGEDFTVKPGWIRAVDRKASRKEKRTIYYFLKSSPAIDAIVRRRLGAVPKGPLFVGPRGTMLRQFPHKLWARMLLQIGLAEEVTAPPRPKKFGAPGPAPTGVTRIVTHVRPHDLRHLVGVTLGEEKVSASVIQKYLHHKSRRASEGYTKHVRPHAIEEAAATLTTRFASVTATS